MKNIFLNGDAPMVHKVFPPEVKAEIGCDPTVYSMEDVKANPEKFQDTQFIFSTWGMPGPSEEEISRYFPSLKAVFYAAGSVQGFAPQFIHCGVTVCSGWGATAVSLAEYTVAQIVLANRGFFLCSRQYNEETAHRCFETKHCFNGNIGTTVGIIGMGMIGRNVRKLLKDYRVEVLAYDPFLSDSRARELEVEKVSLEEMFSRCNVVTNHIADKPETKGMLDYSLFSKLPPYATFINTGRGAQVVDADLAKILAERSDLTALLDVTVEEPVRKGDPFYSLPNCILTPHIAGGCGHELYRLAEFMRDEYQRFLAGETCIYQVTEEMLKTMA